MGNKANNGFADISNFTGCKKVHECRNDACFWRLRTVHGHGVWWSSLTERPPWQDHTDEVLDGKELYLPKFELLTGTNYMGIGCPDFTGIKSFFKG